MKEITATEAARGFKALLDRVERRHETFAIVRGGKAVAAIGPLKVATGAMVKSLLRDQRADPRWGVELASLRKSLVIEDRTWHE